MHVSYVTIPDNLHQEISPANKWILKSITLFVRDDEGHNTVHAYSKTIKTTPAIIKEKFLEVTEPQQSNCPCRWTSWGIFYMMIVD